MANINVRGLSDATKAALRVRAAKAGMSLEAYVRRILQKVSASPELESVPLSDLANKYFGPRNGIELELPERSTRRDPIDFA